MTVDEYVFCLEYHNIHKIKKDKNISKHIPLYNFLLRVYWDEPTVYYKRIYEKHIVEALKKEEDNIKYCLLRNKLEKLDELNGKNKMKPKINKHSLSNWPPIQKNK